MRVLWTLSGLLKEDAYIWALGQAQVIMNNGGSWQITRLDNLDLDKRSFSIELEDKLGARYGIHIAESM